MRRAVALLHGSLPVSFPVIAPRDLRARSTRLLWRAIAASFPRYVAAGAAGTAIHYTVLVALVEFGRTAAASASVAGAIAGAIVNYVLNYHVTFPGAAPHRVTAPRFAAVAALSAALNGAGMHLLVAVGGVNYLAAQVVCTGGVLASGYLLNRVWTFRRVPAHAS